VAYTMTAVWVWNAQANICLFVSQIEVLDKDQVLEFVSFSAF